MFRLGRLNKSTKLKWFLYEMKKKIIYQEETNFGAILTSDSVAVKVRSKELGTIYDYGF